MMCGYEDPKYSELYEAKVKWSPMDDTVQTIISDMSTRDWNPVVFSIFYERPDLFKMISEQGHAYIRNCLTAPFIIDQSTMI